MNSGRVVLDASCLLHGQRAVRRNTTNLYRHLLQLDIPFPLEAFYFQGRRWQVLPLHFPGGAIKTRWPARMLRPLWQSLAWPFLEQFIGDASLYYSPDLIFPPPKRIRVLSTVRGVAYYEIPERFPPAKLKQLLCLHGYALQHSNFWLAVSECTRKSLIERDGLDPSQVFVVSHGVDQMFTRQEEKRARTLVRDRFGIDKPYLLYVGVLDKNKNLRGLLETYRLVLGDIPDMELVLVGPRGNAAMEVDAAVQDMILHNKIHCLGEIDVEDPVFPSLYSMAEVLVHLSYYEGWCAPPLESMACGTPVVLADIPPLREVGGDAAMFVPPDDAQVAAAAVLQLVSNTMVRRQKIELGDEQVARHNWNHSALKFLEIIKQIRNHS